MSRKRLHRAIEVDGETIHYAINRRGCKGRWTKQDDKAMAAIVQAVIRSPLAERMVVEHRVAVRRQRVRDD